MVAVTVPAERDVSDGEPVGPLLGRLQAHLAAPVQRAKPRPVEVVLHNKTSIVAFISFLGGSLPNPYIRDQFPAPSHKRCQ